jgi:SagB-type dehydrogenase family enzyme
MAVRGLVLAKRYSGRARPTIFFGSVAMNMLTKLAQGLIGQYKPVAALTNGSHATHLPLANTSGGLPLMQALAQRHSVREFDPAALPDQTLSDLLWAAAGINRPATGGRTVPSAMNGQEVDLYVALAHGLFRYDPPSHSLQLITAVDVRRVTGYQDFVDTAPMDLVFVADHARMKLVPASRREAYAFAVAGAMAQNVALYCASAGLGAVIRAWFDRGALEQALGLGSDQQVLLAQTVGQPRPPLVS